MLDSQATVWEAIVWEPPVNAEVQGIAITGGETYIPYELLAEL